MSSGFDEMADEVAGLKAQATGAGQRFEEACRKVAAKDLRGIRKQEAEAFFDEVRKLVEAAKGLPGEEGKKEKGHREILVFLMRTSTEGGPLRVEASAEMVEPKHMRDLMEEKEAYALPEEMYRDFSEWFREGISGGAFDSKSDPGMRVTELIYSEFKGASKSWLERKGWDGLSKALEGAS
jgi:hypothetical protein